VHVSHSWLLPCVAVNGMYLHMPPGSLLVFCSGSFQAPGAYIPVPAMCCGLLPVLVRAACGLHLVGMASALSPPTASLVAQLHPVAFVSWSRHRQHRPRFH
jgi:hypothetical protein